MELTPGLQGFAALVRAFGAHVPGVQVLHWKGHQYTQMQAMRRICARRDHVCEAERVIGELCCEILGTGGSRLALVGIERLLLLVLLQLVMMIGLLIVVVAPGLARHPGGITRTSRVGVVIWIEHPHARVPLIWGDIHASRHRRRTLERRGKAIWRLVLDRGIVPAVSIGGHCGVHPSLHTPSNSFC